MPLYSIRDSAIMGETSAAPAANVKSAHLTVLPWSQFYSFKKEYFDSETSSSTRSNKGSFSANDITWIPAIVYSQSFCSPVLSGEYSDDLSVSHNCVWAYKCYSRSSFVFIEKIMSYTYRNVKDFTDIWNISNIIKILFQNLAQCCKVLLSLESTV